MTFFPHYLLQFSGHAGDTNEQWSCGIRMVIWDGPEPIDIETDAEQYLTDTGVPALSTWFASGGARIQADAKLLTVKFNRILPNGHYAEIGATHVRQINISGGVSGPTNCHPLQVCYCLSFRTDLAARGPGSHGRIYVPRPVVSVGASGDIGGSDRVAMADAGAILIESLDTSSGLPPAAVIRPSIVSNITGAVPHQIDYVTVDSSLDIQRRRSRSQSKELTSSDVNY